MPSHSFRKWASSRTDALDEIAQAHVAVGGTLRGRRYATQQINRMYAVLLASQFQGFCRDLHSESVDFVVSMISPVFQRTTQAAFVHNCQLDRGNAQPGSVGADFGRLGIDLWTKADNHDPDNGLRRTLLDELNQWRNAIVHEDFDPGKLGGTVTLQLRRVKEWRQACDGLSRSFDIIMRDHFHSLTGTAPW